MKQFEMFGDEKPKEESIYTSKIKGPQYEPKNKKPHVLELVDKSKFNRLKNEIQGSNLSEEEKVFLTMAATRHLIFNYAKIADYYAHSNKNIQELMEKSALVIIDFDKAYQYGYMKLAYDLANNYLDSHEK
jgi:hypothetical protein